MSSKVSAIITTHNRSQLAIKAINSVLSQSYNNIELIVVDDASDFEHKDRLIQYARSYKFKYYYICQEDSRGGNYARNKGIEISDGEYIAFLDDDDEWLSTKIEKQVAFLDKNVDYSFVACGKIYELDYGKEVYEDDVENLPDGNMAEKIIYSIPYTTSAIMIKRHILEKTGLFDEKLKYWQEYELEMRLSGETPFGVVRENLVLYRIIRTDKQRLTNNINGWDDAVNYINRKHKLLIASQSIFVKRERKRLIALDGINRAIAAGASKRKYLLMLFFIEPRISSLIKIVFDVCRFREIYIVKKILDRLNILKT